MGILPGKFTIDKIFTLRQILEETHEFQVDTDHLIINFKQAYDSIRRDKFLAAMYVLGIPAKVVNIRRVTLVGTKSVVKDAGKK